LRKKQLKKQILRMPKKTKMYSDFGCSNGYLTKIFSDILSSITACGYDHHSENIKIAKSNYPNINFDYIDLNKVNEFSNKSDVISCFETLEHVGKPQNAIKSIKNACQMGTSIVISVPIEIGFWGIIKYIIKRFFFKYDLPINCSDLDYFYALLTGRDINRYRQQVAEGYGSHFGFDYRIIDKMIESEFPNCKTVMFNKFTTRFYHIEVSQI
jgi:2-polyprenyl-3-methyl-5-hydroxy-6-metoxy-1,4-benzoquinol methylase